MSEEKMILTVLNEVLEELQKANNSLKEMGEKMVALEARVQAFEKKEIRIEPPDLGPVSIKVSEECAALRQETAAGLSRVAAAVEAQPKPIIRRISFFPENDYPGNYKTFIRWLIGGTVGALVVVSAYVLSNEWIGRMPRQPVITGTEMNLRVDTPAEAKPAVLPAKKPGKHARGR